MGISRFYTETATIQRYETTSDGAGYHTNEWQLLMKVKGTLDMLSGVKLYQAESHVSEYTHIFMCGMLPILVTPKDRLVVGNRIFDIVYVDDPVGRKHHQEILLKFNSLLNENAQGTDNLAFHRLYTETGFSG